MSECDVPARPQHSRSRIMRGRQVAKKTQGNAMMVAAILKMAGADAISARPYWFRAGRKRHGVSDWVTQGRIKNVKSLSPVKAIAALQKSHVTLKALCGLATGPEFVRGCSKKTEKICTDAFETGKKKRKANERFHSSDFRSGRLKRRHRERTWKTASISIAVDSGTGGRSDRHSCPRDHSRSAPWRGAWRANSLG